MKLRRISMLVLVLFAAVLLVACNPKKFKVTFDTQGGSPVEAVEVVKGKLLQKPAVDPTKDGYTFLGWFKAADSEEPFDFTKPIVADVTVWARWSEKVVISFDSRVQATIPSQEVEPGTEVAEPEKPSKEGFKFAGWFKTKRGLTWLEPEAVKFPLVAEESLKLYAYYEPLNSKTHAWSRAETYISSMSSDTTIILNPFTYSWAHEADLMDMLRTPLYTTEVDWELAIKDGVAAFPGDFSKIANKEFSIDALDYHRILGGAKAFPKDSNMDEHLTVDGKYNRKEADTINDTEWTFELRNDVFFEDGTPVTAHTFEFALKQYLDKNQNNSRANIYYKTEDNINGYPILNAFEYYSGTKEWADVGFKVIDEYTFRITTHEEISQARAVAFGNMVIVHPEKYQSSLNASHKSTYGTPETPFVSYGGYLIKTWDENQKLVFNKNYESIQKGIINYKSRVIEIVDNEDQKFELFDRGDLSVVGLTKDHYAKYSEREGIFRSYNGFPMSIFFNLAASKFDEGTPNRVTHPTIMYDKEFRQAFLYGFDRKYFNGQVYAPNTPSILPFPAEAKVYQKDALTFAESAQYKQVLQEFNISEETMGYIPEKAKQLFNSAYDRWVAAGNTGAVKIIMIAGTDDFGRALNTYIKESYETLFGSDKLQIEIREFESEALKAQQDAWNFDIQLSAIGFESSLDAHEQMAFIGMAGGAYGGDFLGMSQPFDESSTHPEKIAEYFLRVIEVALPNTWAHIQGFTEEEIAEKPAMQKMYDWLKAAEGKEEGVFKGTVKELSDYMVSTNVFSSSGDTPFAGASIDAYDIIAAFLKVYYDFVPTIPTSARSSAVLYEDSVVIDWPAYSLVFGWGAERYRYLNTDADFQQ